MDLESAAAWAARAGGDVDWLRRYLVPANSIGTETARDVDRESVMAYGLPAEVFRSEARADCALEPGPRLSVGDKLAAMEAYP